MKQLRSVGIHDGAFHADEVTACALLVVFGLVDENKIIRTRDPLKLAACEYVCDVGGFYDHEKRLFDHHQASYKGELSSAGMILLFLKTQQLITEEEFAYFETALIKGVDEHDNGKAPQELGYCSFSHVIANFNPPDYEAPEEELNKAFFKALHFTEGHLKRLRERYQYNVECRKLVKAAMETYHQCLFFEKAIPWLESFFALDGKHHPALFVIMPAGEHWKLRGIPPDYAHRMQVRLQLPASWAGLLEEDLKRVSHISGAVFCHKGRFTSVWETRKDAEEALKYVLHMQGIKYENHF